MGNSSSHPDLNISDLYNAMDYIAAYYILTTDYENLSKLSEKSYCDKLSNLTSTIVNTSSTKDDLFFLQQRIKHGWSKTPSTPYDLALPRQEQTAVSKLLTKNQCNHIAKFYVKIAHIFASILTTINPVYMYKNTTGQIIRRTKADDTLGREISNTNICDSRISELKNRETFLTTSSETTPNTPPLPPTFCDVTSNQSSGQTLDDEPGIRELKQLYYDEYDYDTGEFSKMSEKASTAFKSDLAQFYKEFTGETDVPPTITTFSDIKLKTYNRSAVCDNPLLNASPDNISRYSASIRDMIKTASSKQLELLKIIDILFIFVQDQPNDNDTTNQSHVNKIRINPTLTETILNEVIIKTRGLIMDLYLGCEKDYTNSLKIFESILEKQIFETTISQIKNMESQINQIVDTQMPVQQPSIHKIQQPNIHTDNK